MASCIQPNPVEEIQGDISANTIAQNQDSTVCYAKGFRILHHPECTELVVINPWEGAEDIDYHYYLFNRDAKIPEKYKDKHIIRTPIRSIVCLSTTHVAFLDFIDETNSITGLSGNKYINNQKVCKRIAKKQIRDVGFDQVLNIELLMSLKPDIVMAYGIGSEISGLLNKLNSLQINTIINSEYLESTPLGKAEWVKFVAALFNKEDIAHERFDSIAIEYNNLKTLVTGKNIARKPTVLTNLPWKGSWYIPGGKSYVARLINDAGGQFMWAGNTARDPFPLSIEAVYIQAHIADLWINTGAANSLTDITNVDNRLSEFKSFQTGRIYNNNARINQSGGNDYMESGTVNPHIILKDLIAIFHPEILPKHELFYYKKLSD